MSILAHRIAPKFTPASNLSFERREASMIVVVVAAAACAAYANKPTGLLTLHSGLVCRVGRRSFVISARKCSGRCEPKPHRGCPNYRAQ